MPHWQQHHSCQYTIYTYTSAEPASVGAVCYKPFVGVTKQLDKQCNVSRKERGYTVTKKEKKTDKEKQ